MRIISDVAPVVITVDLYLSEDEMRAAAFQAAEDICEQLCDAKARYQPLRLVTTEWFVRMQGKGTYRVTARLSLPPGVQTLSDPERVRIRADELRAAEVPVLAQDVLKLLRGALGP